MSMLKREISKGKKESIMDLNTILTKGTVHIAARMLGISNSTKSVRIKKKRNCPEYSISIDQANPEMPKPEFKTLQGKSEWIDSSEVLKGEDLGEFASMSLSDLANY